jgi:hypothetical protein
VRLGDEHIELMEVMTPKGRPIPIDSRSNDVWFQHVAIIVSDMGRAFDWLRARDLTYASPEPQRLPDWNPNAGGIEASISRTRTATIWRCWSFRRARATRNGIGPRKSCF